MSSPETPTLAPLHDQIAQLFSGEEHGVEAGHVDLGPDIWLSTDPAGRGRIDLRPAEGAGVTLSLAKGDSGRWCCLGMRVSAKALSQARYVGVLIALRTDILVSYTPTLRYYLNEGGHRDVPVETPVVAVGKERDILSHIPVDHELLAQSRDCEINLFFHNDAFTGDLLRLEPLLIL